MIGPRDRDVDKKHGIPAHSLSKCQNDDYSLTSLVVSQLQNPSWGSQLMPSTWPITLGYRRDPGFICLLRVVAGLAEGTTGPAMSVLMVWVGPAKGPQAQQHQWPHWQALQYDQGCCSRFAGPAEPQQNIVS